MYQIPIKHNIVDKDSILYNKKLKVKIVMKS